MRPDRDLNLEPFRGNSNTRAVGFNIWLTRIFLPPLICVRILLVPSLLRAVVSTRFLRQQRYSCRRINLAHFGPVAERSPDERMSECLGKLVQRQVAVQICLLSVCSLSCPLIYAARCKQKDAAAAGRDHLRKQILQFVLTRFQPVSVQSYITHYARPSRSRLEAIASRPSYSTCHILKRSLHFFFFTPFIFPLFGS